MTQAIGKPINRVDGRLKVTGDAKYSGEIPLENIAYGVIITSTIARGRIKHIDTSVAEKSPGVIGIITHLDAPKLYARPNFGHEGAAGEKLAPLQNSTIHYSGQAIGVAIADTLERATYAASLVKVDYEVETPLTEMGKERDRAYPIKKFVEFTVDFALGDAEGEFAKAAVKIEATYTTPTEHHNPMEPHATAAVWEGDCLTVYDSTQYIFGMRQGLAKMLGLPEANVRVLCKFIGGAFGCKYGMWAHTPLAAIAARQFRRPVKIVLTRQQMFGLVGHRSETEQQIKLGATPDGHLTALIHQGISQTSIFDEFVETFTTTSRTMYAVPNLRTAQSVVPLNKGTPTIMRAPGESVGTFALESAMDELAWALKLDPIELRLRNYAEVHPARQVPWSSKSLKECYALAAEKFGWSRRTPEPGSMRDDRYLIGMGMASACFPMEHFPASAIASIFADGSVVVQSGSQEIGTGTATVMAQVTADVLGVPVEKVRFEFGDTELARSPGTVGSGTAGSVGTAVHGAAKAVRAKVLELAQNDPNSPLYAVAETDIETDRERIFVKNNPAKGETYQAVLARHNLQQIDASFDAKPQEEEEFAKCSFGAHFVEVRVDPELGEVRVTRIVGAFAAGRILNEKTARSQISGATIMGIGMALHEETIADPRTGRTVNDNLAEYHLPVNADIPSIDVYFIDEVDTHVNPIGVKGVGEVGLTGMIAAIANAVYHATGKRIRDLPITPDKLL